MKNLFIALLLCSFQVASAATPPVSTNYFPVVKQGDNLPPSITEILKLKIRDAEKIAGKKFSLKEKIAFKLLQHKYKKSQHPAEENWAKKGKTAMILGIIALGILFIPYAGLASIPLAIIAIAKGNKVKKADPGNKQAKTGVILGWIALAVFAVFIIIAAAYAAAFMGGFN